MPLNNVYNDDDYLDQVVRQFTRQTEPFAYAKTIVLLAAVYVAHLRDSGGPAFPLLEYTLVFYDFKRRKSESIRYWRVSRGYDNSAVRQWITTRGYDVSQGRMDYLKTGLLQMHEAKLVLASLCSDEEVQILLVRKSEIVWAATNHDWVPDDFVLHYVKMMDRVFHPPDVFGLALTQTEFRNAVTK